jgi:transcriptional regulator with AAA-type ATPase domain
MVEFKSVDKEKLAQMMQARGTQPVQAPAVQQPVPAVKPQQAAPAAAVKPQVAQAAQKMAQQAGVPPQAARPAGVDLARIQAAAQAAKMQQAAATQVAKPVVPTAEMFAALAAKIQPVEDLPEYHSALYYGISGTGKTTLAGTYPTPMLVVDIRENGTGSICNIPGVKVLKLESWEQFELLHSWLAAGD